MYVEIYDVIDGFPMGFPMTAGFPMTIGFPMTAGFPMTMGFPVTLGFSIVRGWHDSLRDQLRAVVQSFVLMQFSAIKAENFFSIFISVLDFERIS